MSIGDLAGALLDGQYLECPSKEVRDYIIGQLAETFDYMQPGFNLNRYPNHLYLFYENSLAELHVSCIPPECTIIPYSHFIEEEEFEPQLFEELAAILM